MSTGSFSFNMDIHVTYEALRHGTISAKTQVNWSRYICMTNYNWFVSFLFMLGEYLEFLIVWWCRTYFATLLWKLNLRGRWLRMMILMRLLVVVFQRYAKKMQLFNTGSKRTLIRPLDVKEYRFLQKKRH